MNIFAIEYNADGGIDWRKSAKSQDNYRVVKMILESCQMLCTALNEQHGTQIAPYRSTHKKHPSTLWAGLSSANFMSLVDHCDAMLEEYTERFGKVHKCTAVLQQCINLFDASKFAFQELTPLPLAMPIEYKSDDTVLSYRKFYSSKPRIRYPVAKVPEWFASYRGDTPYQTI